MKKSVIILAIVGVCIFSSCVSMQARQMTPEERNESRIIGTVTTSWTAVHFLHIKPSVLATEEKAISRLRVEAQRQGYEGNIDIRNLRVEGSFNPLFLLPVPFLYGILGNVQKITATGDIVEQAGRGMTSTVVQRRMSEATSSATAIISEKLPAGSSIAILNIYSSDRSVSEYIIGELEFNFVNSGNFRIVDRRRLDNIRNEQNFQLSGEVSDDSAVSIGNMLGANIVVTGEIIGYGSNQLLVLRALDVMTGQIIAMSREQL